MAIKCQVGPGGILGQKEDIRGKESLEFNEYNVSCWFMMVTMNYTNVHNRGNCTGHMAVSILFIIPYDSKPVLK